MWSLHEGNLVRWEVLIEWLIWLLNMESRGNGMTRLTSRTRGKE